MKYAIIALLCLLSLTAFAQQDSISANLKYVGDKIETAVTALAEKMGVAADYVYPLVVRQQVITGHTVVGSAIIMLALALCLSWLSVTSMKRFINSGGDPILQVFGLVFSAGLCIAAMIMIPNALLWINNPEYYAIKEILSLIK